MIAYEDLTAALDRYNRRRRGEVVDEPADAYEMTVDEDEYIMEAHEAEAVAEQPQVAEAYDEEIEYDAEPEYYEGDVEQVAEAPPPRDPEYPA